MSPVVVVVVVVVFLTASVTASTAVSPPTPPEEVIDANKSFAGVMTAVSPVDATPPRLIQSGLTSGKVLRQYTLFPCLTPA